MKRALFFTVLLVSLLSCKETEFSPEGPTDVRIWNNSDMTMTDVFVNTSGGIKSLGSVNAGNYSDYARFDKAFPKAEISAVINGQSFTTGPVDYIGLTYIGQAKITYEVWILDKEKKILTLKVVYPLDGPLD